MAKTNAEILEIARRNAKRSGKGAPRTAADVERYSGFFYTGPDPIAIGKTYSVPVKRLK